MQIKWHKGKATFNQGQNLSPKYNIFILKNLKCINSECITNKDNEMNSDIIYIKYNHENLKYLYICTKCKTSWKNK